MAKKLKKEQLKEVRDFLQTVTKNTTEDEVKEILKSTGCDSLQELEDAVINQSRKNMTEEDFRNKLVYTGAKTISELPVGNQFFRKEGSYYSELTDPDAKKNWVLSPYTFACGDKLIGLINANYIDNHISSKTRDTDDDLKMYARSTGDELIEILTKTLAFKMNAIISSYFSDAFSALQRLLQEDKQGMLKLCSQMDEVNAAYAYYYDQAAPIFQFTTTRFASRIIELIFTSNGYRFISGLDEDTNNAIYREKMNNVITDATLTVSKALADWLFLYLPLTTATTPMWYIQQMNFLTVELHDSIYDLVNQTLISILDSAEKIDTHYDNAFTVLMESPTTGLDKFGAHRSNHYYDY